MYFYLVPAGPAHNYLSIVRDHKQIWFSLVLQSHFHLPLNLIIKGQIPSSNIGSGYARFICRFSVNVHKPLQLIKSFYLVTQKFMM